MIKKLVIAATFAGSLLVGVPTASASPFLCMQQYQAALAACEGDDPCETFANISYTQCLDKLAQEHS
jgi:hypothetical protein